MSRRPIPSRREAPSTTSADNMLTVPDARRDGAGGNWPGSGVDDLDIDDFGVDFVVSGDFAPELVG